MLNRPTSLILTLSLAVIHLSAQEPEYRPVNREPVNEALRTEIDSLQDTRAGETDAIRARQDARAERERQNRRELTIDWTGIAKPSSPDDFKQVWHFPPTRQYLTGTCWSFATTSFLESEILRQYGKKIKLSEMYTAYHEYLLKARRFVAERGDSYIAQGSESNAVVRVWQEFGAIPRDIYPGVTRLDGYFQHETMISEIEAYLDWIEQQGLWDIILVENSMKVIMDRYLGTPPEHFIYEGLEYTPRQFLEEVLWIDLDDYVCLLSNMKYPFHEYCEFEVPDNWWFDSTYYNVPLDEFYAVVGKALDEGYSVLLGGDISEPGIEPLEDAAIIPAFDIPAAGIGQAARELRIDNETTTDDHLIHVVGHTRVGRDNWFLIKDSGSGAQLGQHKGYYFYREDYIKMKMLMVMVHKQIVQKVVKEF